MLRAALTVLVVALGSWALAGVCMSELEDVALVQYDANSPTGLAPTGLAAARLLERAVTLVEPALPGLVAVRDAPVEVIHPDFATVMFLAERRLLPSSWSPDAIDAETWSDMLSRFLAWYDIDPYMADIPGTHQDLITDTASVLASVSAAIRPAAVLASDPLRESGLAFRALIMNWSVYPRLVVFRSDADIDGRVDTGRAIASMETCARRIRHYFSASEETATRLFLANQRADMIVVGSVPADSRRWPWWVPSGDEVGVFAFEHAAVEELSAYSVVFDGPAISIPALVRLLPRIRTNVSPLGLREYLQSPR